MKTIIDAKNKEFDEKIDPIYFDVRNHTCDTWNGLNDDMYGRAYLSDEGKEKIKAHITSTIREVLEFEVKRLEGTNSKLFGTICFDEGYHAAIQDIETHYKQIIKSL